MRTIPEKELQINLDSILSRAQSERIVISRRGKPCAVLVGIEDYDPEDLRLASSAEFWRMIRQRRASGRSFSLAEVEVRLGTTRRQPAAKRAAAKRTRKQS
jgi:prevent-host-death family protein